MTKPRFNQIKVVYTCTGESCGNKEHMIPGERICPAQAICSLCGRPMNMKIVTIRKRKTDV